MNSMSNLKDLSAWQRPLPLSQTMPVLFVGHGTPMNAIQDTPFSRQWQQIAQQIARPTAILCISAHWLTKGGTAVTAMQYPQTIHDFGGFPQALFDVHYPASGNQALIEETIAAIDSVDVHKDFSWGLDHGTWSILRHMYPEADIPVVQFSIDYARDAAYHYALGRELASLRRKGVLIVASGNMIHNLRMISRNPLHLSDYGYDWALEADAKMQDYLLSHQHQKLIDWQQQGQAFQLSIPTPDHYYPMLYALGLQQDQDKLQLFNATTSMGSLSMTSFILNPA